MKTLHKILSAVLCICFLTVLLAGCEKKESVPPESGPISVYASFYPLYAAAELILQDVPDMKLNCLVQPQDGCLRNYQLSDWDLALLNASDVILAGGRGLESFEGTLYALGENGPAVSSVLYNMDLTQQAAVNTQEDAQSHWIDPNPHIYMRTDGMLEIVQRIANSLILLDETHKELYLKNLENAKQRLNQLADEIQEEAAEIQGQGVIVMNEALIYSAQELGLEIELCYDRESGENLFDNDLTHCLNVLKQTDAKVVLIEKQAPQAFCRALEAAGYQLARMDILSTRRAAEGSEAYFSAQRANVRSVKDAFIEANMLSD